MIRPILIETTLFLTPFVLYAAFLLATRVGVFDPEHWSPRTLVGLTSAALVLMIVSFLFFADFSGAPPDSVYEPAHMENGKFVPGRVR